MPGGFGTLDELAEILTLIQTGKSRRIPVILVDKPFWEGLVGWFEETLIKAGTISESDLELFKIIDDPQQIVDEIFNYYEQKGFEKVCFIGGMCRGYSFASTKYDSQYEESDNTLHDIAVKKAVSYTSGC